MSDSPVQPDQTREAIEERLRAEFQEAKTAYDAATATYQGAVQRCDELERASQQGKMKLGSVATGPSITLALKEQHDAFKSVSRALKAFNDFVLYGELPDEPNGPKTKDSEVMTDAEFEDAYREALISLADTGRTVGQPIGSDGGRVCIVDGKPLSDCEVLELWWGKEITESIRRQRRHK